MGAHDVSRRALAGPDRAKESRVGRQFEPTALTAYTERSREIEGCSGLPLQATGWSGRHPHGRCETRRMRVGRLGLQIIRALALHVSRSNPNCRHHGAAGARLKGSCESRRARRPRSHPAGNENCLASRRRPSFRSCLMFSRSWLRSGGEMLLKIALPCSSPGCSASSGCTESAISCTYCSWSA